MIKYILFFLAISTSAFAGDQPIGQFNTDNNYPIFGYNNNGSSFMITNGGQNTQFYSDTNGKHCTINRFGNTVYQNCY
jgi:hypothetical protein